MVLSLARLTILLGAGVVGSVMAKEGRLPDFSGIVSSGFKVVFKQLQSNDSTSTVPKPHNDNLLAQVNNLRDEIKDLVRDGGITILNGSGTDGRKYVTVVIIGVGCGCLWWKGWFPDLRFATRRSLNDACTDIGNQLGKVYGSIEEAKTKLSAKVTGAEKIIDAIAVDALNTQADIDAIQSKTKLIDVDLKGFRPIIELLQDKINEIEEKQNDTNNKVGGVRRFIEILETGTPPQNIQGPSSMPAIEELPPVSPSSKAVQSGPSRLYLEQPSITPISRAESVPPTRSADPPSPSNTVESVQEISPVFERTSSFSRVNSTRTPTTGNVNNGSSSGGFFGMNLSSMYAPLLRTRSATNAIIQETRPSS
ncbi:unnamed protein product [Trifolium pratense]|uniref:Uncharacterized protein n=1 Tax=Trifolium pratense TaxID=57577 RepID=A0ACB0LL51_TRIPR|nr:unnamed protein product [Trifolium pratense]